jgi:hypothetical protein
MLRLAAGGLILALLIAVTGSAAGLGVLLRNANEAPDPRTEVRMREIEALIASARQASAICTSAPTKPEPQTQ